MMPQLEASQQYPAALSPRHRDLFLPPPLPRPRVDPSALVLDYRKSIDQRDSLNHPWHAPTGSAGQGHSQLSEQMGCRHPLPSVRHLLAADLPVSSDCSASAKPGGALGVGSGMKQGSSMDFQSRSGPNLASRTPFAGETDYVRQGKACNQQDATQCHISSPQNREESRAHLDLPMPTLASDLGGPESYRGSVRSGTPASCSSAAARRRHRDLPHRRTLSPDVLHSREAEPTPKIVSEGIRRGHGPVWVYENGETCPKAVNGEPVNGEWGITKAGKPRKRLALACTACRSKKIKCHPARPRCNNCDRFDRLCRYTTAVRHTQNVPDSLLPDHAVHRDQGMAVFPASESQMTCPTDRPSKQHASDPHDSVWRTDGRRRRDQVKGYGKHVSQVMDISTLNTFQPRGPSLLNDSNLISDKTNVVDARRADGDIRVMRDYLSLFHDHVAIHDQGSFSPTLPFSDLLQKFESLSASLSVLLHAMLALGTTFAVWNGHEADGRTYSKVAHQAILEQAQTQQQHQHPEIEHARLILALYYLTTGQEMKAWSLAASGLPDIVTTDYVRRKEEEEEEEEEDEEDVETYEQDAFDPGDWRKYSLPQRFDRQRC